METIYIDPPFMRLHAEAYTMRERIKEFRRLNSFLLWTISSSSVAQVGAKGKTLR
jgi:hypothetical protein